MTTEMVIVNVPLIPESIPAADAEPGKTLGYMNISLASDEVSRMIGDGWEAQSHQILPSPNGGLMVSLLCTREKPLDTIELPEL